MGSLKRTGLASWVRKHHGQALAKKREERATDYLLLCEFCRTTQWLGSDLVLKVLAPAEVCAVFEANCSM